MTWANPEGLIGSSGPEPWPVGSRAELSPLWYICVIASHFRLRYKLSICYASRVWFESFESFGKHRDLSLTQHYIPSEYCFNNTHNEALASHRTHTTRSERESGPESLLQTIGDRYLYGNKYQNNIMSNIKLSQTETKSETIVTFSDLISQLWHNWVI